MPILSATEVTIYAPSISASAATIAAGNWIAVVQDRINWITNNYFTTAELYMKGSFTFYPSVPSIVCTESFETAGFADGDEVYVYHSHRNDGYYTVDTVSSGTLTLASSEAVVDELSGRSILISVVQWPRDLKATAAQMVEYDYDKRADRGAGVKSVTLGPWSESYGQAGSGEYGYPEDIIAPLYDHKMVRII